MQSYAVKGAIQHAPRPHARPENVLWRVDDGRLIQVIDLGEVLQAGGSTVLQMRSLKLQAARSLCQWLDNAILYGDLTLAQSSTD